MFAPFVRRSNDRRVCVTVVIGSPEDLFEGCDLQGSFSNNRTSQFDRLVIILIGSAERLFQHTYVIERPILTSDV